MAQSYEEAIIRRNFQLWRCHGSPPIWGQDRQSLVGALPWFYNAQSGFASLTAPIPDGTKPACGMLANGYGGNRNYLDTEIAILSINSAKSDSAVSAGRKARMDEAIQNRCVVGLIIAKRATVKKEQTSLAPDDGSGAASGGLDPENTSDDDEPGDDESAAVFFPGTNIDLEGFESFVLGWFLPVKMWPEAVLTDQNNDQKKRKAKTPPKDGKKVIWMVKLQIQDLSQQTWWASLSHPIPPPLTARNFGTLTKQIACTSCGGISPEIYQEGFVCLNDLCAQGPAYVGGSPLTHDQSMTYNDAFLMEREDHRQSAIIGPRPHPDFVERFQYTAPVVQNWDMRMVAAEVHRLLEVAICPACGMANSRLAWTGWTCGNRSCPSPLNLPACPPRFSLHDVQHLGVPPSTIFHPPSGDYQQFFQSKFPNYYKGITTSQHFTIHSFELRSECHVEVMMPLQGTNAIQHGSDFMYQRLLLLAESDNRMDLRRRKTSRGFLTNHFNQNFGAPYQMKVAAGEMSFEQAPPEIRAAVDQANRWTNPFRSNTDGGFNEMYLAGYLHESRMNFHQDGERGLNDKILTWSLGGCGTFTIAVDSKICRGKSTGRNWLTEDPLVPGSRKYDERVALKNRLDKGEITADQYAEGFKALFKDDKGKDGNRVLTLPATHGILILMHGKAMQRYYQHKMEVHGPMRFALTFRHIGAENQAPKPPAKRKAEESLQAEEDQSKKPTGAAGKGSGGKGGSPAKKQQKMTEGSQGTKSASVTSRPRRGGKATA